MGQWQILLSVCKILVLYLMMSILKSSTKINLEEKWLTAKNFKIIAMESTAYFRDFVLMKERTILLLLKNVTKNIFKDS